MTTIAPLRYREGLRRMPSSFDGAGGEPTLDELLVGVWEELTAHAVAPCPVCGAHMAAECGADSPVGGRCNSCGSRLS